MVAARPLLRQDSACTSMVRGQLHELSTGHNRTETAHTQLPDELILLAHSACTSHRNSRM